MVAWLIKYRAQLVIAAIAVAIFSSGFFVGDALKQGTWDAAELKRSQSQYGLSVQHSAEEKAKKGVRRENFKVLDDMWDGAADNWLRLPKTPCTTRLPNLPKE